MPEISLNTDITFTIKTRCMLCGETLMANISVDHQKQTIFISVDPSHNCFDQEINETNQSLKGPL